MIAGPGLGATWDKKLLRAVGAAVGTEARAVHNNQTGSNRPAQANGMGITLYSPNMNLVRDPRWGRNQEVYSECPRLSSALTVSFVRGVQRGSAPSPSLDGPVEGAAPSKYVQAGACCKHLVAYDVETNRMSNDAQVPARSFWEFYVPTFHSCLVEAEAMSSMCSCEASTTAALSAAASRF